MDELDPVFFIKLAPDAKRPKVKRPLSQLPLLRLTSMTPPDQVEVDALKDKWWQQLLVEFPSLPPLHLRLVTVDRATISLQTKSNMVEEFRAWILQQEGVHEVLQDENVFRKPGLRPLEQLRAYLAKELRRAQRSKFVEAFKKRRGKGKGTRGLGLGRGRGGRPAGRIGPGVKRGDRNEL